MLSENRDRLDDPRMDFFRNAYKNSREWDGKESLEGKRLLVYCEQGFGDVIQFARYIPHLRARGAKVTLHCPAELHRLFACLKCDLLDKRQAELPEHDLHALSMSLPFLLGVWDVHTPYLEAGSIELPAELKTKTKIGIAWESGPESPCGELRNCPLKHFLALQSPKTALFMTQKEIRTASLIAGAESLELNGWPIQDFQDTAQLINAMDYVVSVDTAVLHLAGSLGKFTFGLLPHDCDHRWLVDPWYSNFVLIRQKTAGDWQAVFDSLVSILKTNNIL